MAVPPLPAGAWSDGRGAVLLLACVLGLAVAHWFGTVARRKGHGFWRGFAAFFLLTPIGGAIYVSRLPTRDDAWARNAQRERRARPGDGGGGEREVHWVGPDVTGLGGGGSSGE
jgi:hypothetical protein